MVEEIGRTTSYITELWGVPEGLKLAIFKDLQFKGILGNKLGNANGWSLI